MNTSNKLIAFGLFVLFIGMIAFLCAAKNAIIPRSELQNSNGAHEIRYSDQDKSIIYKDIGSYSGQILKLSHHHNYILNPNSNLITIEGPSYIVNELTLTDDSNIFEIPKYIKRETSDRNTDKENYDYIKEVLTINIGVANKQTLTIAADKSSVISSSDTLSINSINLSLSDYSSCTATIVCNELSIDLKTKAQAQLSGESDHVKVNARNSSSIISADMKMKEIEIHLDGSSSLTLDKVEKISGIMSDRTMVQLTKEIDISKVLIEDSAKIIFGKSEK